MERARWRAVCGICALTKSGPTRAEVVFALERHRRVSGHIPWKLGVVEPPAPPGEESPGGRPLHPQPRDAQPLEPCRGG